MIERWVSEFKSLTVQYRQCGEIEAPKVWTKIEDHVRQLVEFDDLFTHLHDFRNACELAEQTAASEADRSYWQKQVNTCDAILEQVNKINGSP